MTLYDHVYAMLMSHEVKYHKYSQNCLKGKGCQSEMPIDASGSTSLHKFHQCTIRSIWNFELVTVRQSFHNVWPYLMTTRQPITAMTIGFPPLDNNSNCKPKFNL